MSNEDKLLGKKVLAYRGYMPRHDFQGVSIDFILFDDKATFLALEEQDRYDYHDFNPYARVPKVGHDPEIWDDMYCERGQYRESTSGWH